MAWPRLSKLIQGVKDFTQIVDGWQAFQLQWQLKYGTPPNKSHKALLERYVGWAYICASRNASAVASVPLRLYATRGTGEQKARRNARTLSRDEVKRLQDRPFGTKTAARLSSAQDVEEILEHPFLDLMANINAQENEFEHREKTSIYQDCCGNAYWYMEVNPVLGIPTALYLLPSQYVKVIPDRATLIKGYLYGSDPNTAHAFDASEVIHFRMPNPNSIYYGLGCIEAALRAVDRYASMDEYDETYSRNLGVPPFMVRYKVGHSTPEQRKEVENEWNRVMKTKNAGRVKVADSDWEIEKLATEPKEMGFAEGRRWTRLEICDAFGVPIALVDTENVNLANARTALFQYQKFTIAPRLIRMEQKINERLIPYYDEPRLFAAYDDCVPEDEEFELRKQTEYLKNKVVTVNEVRAHEGMDPVEWGDEPTPDPTPSINFGDRPSSLPAKQVRKKHVHVHGKAKQPPLTPNEKKIRNAMQSLFDKQRDEALRDVDIGGIHFDWVASESWAREIAGLTRQPIESEVVVGAAHGARAIGQSVNLAEWVKRPEVVDWIDTHVFKFARAVNQATHDAMRTALEEGISNGESIAELRSRMEQVFDGFKQADRAEMIARTESARAITGGTLRQWKESGVVTKIVWDASKGDACDVCAELDGMVVDINADFAKMGDEIAGMEVTYENINGPPAHPNCRCSLQAVLSDEYQQALQEVEA